MRAGDVVLANNNNIVTTHVVMTAISTAVDLSAGSTIGSTTNAD